MTVNEGRRLAIDYGDVRIGVAVSDNSRLVASPLETLSNGDNSNEAQKRISEICKEMEISVIYIGLPLQLSGAEGASALKVRTFANQLATHLPKEVFIRLIDERLTTTSAHKSAREGGRKLSKLQIDQYAAVAILEGALHAESNNGAIAGRSLA
ncbi:MAG: Holliday junction resolvase RuvX [Actinomycetota bacterium]